MPHAFSHNMPDPILLRGDYPEYRGSQRQLEDFFSGLQMRNFYELAY
jgi:hypothetical protein